MHCTFSLSLCIYCNLYIHAQFQLYKHWCMCCVAQGGQDKRAVCSHGLYYGQNCRQYRERNRMRFCTKSCTCKWTLRSYLSINYVGWVTLSIYVCQRVVSLGAYAIKSFMPQKAWVFPICCHFHHILSSKTWSWVPLVAPLGYAQSLPQILDQVGRA